MFVLTELFLFFSFAVLGAGIKLVDDAFDLNAFSKNKAIILAIFVGLFWGYLMSLNIQISTILGAVAVGVLVAKKIDNKGHWFGLIGIIIGLLLFGFPGFLWLIFLGLLGAGLVDEIGNDLADKKKFNKFFNKFFEHRLTMNLVVLIFVLIGSIDLIYFGLFIVFDLSYELVGKIQKT